MDEQICGVHPVYEALAAGRRRIERIHIAREERTGRVREIIEMARRQGISIRRDERVVLDRLARGAAHQGVVAVCGVATYSPLDRLLGVPSPLIVVLDGIEDPQNLGAVIRTAEAAGASGIVIPERRATPLTAAAVRASAGASEYLPVARVTNIAAAIDEMKSRGLWIAGVVQDGDQLWTGFDYTGPVALVLGGEHRGLRRLVRERCDVLVRLPMAGRIESLNVSVAAGILLYEVVRQRHSTDKGERIAKKGV